MQLDYTYNKTIVQLFSFTVIVQLEYNYDTSLTRTIVHIQLQQYTYNMNVIQF